MVKLGGVPPVKADVSYPSRILDTVYQNTTGRPKVVIVTVLCDKGAAGDDCFIRSYVKSSSPPDVQAGLAGHVAKVGGATDKAYFCLTFFVPNGYYYMVETNVGASSIITLTRWSEVQL